MRVAPRERDPTEPPTLRRVQTVVCEPGGESSADTEPAGDPHPDPSVQA